MEEQTEKEMDILEEGRKFYLKLLTPPKLRYSLSDEEEKIDRGLFLDCFKALLNLLIGIQGIIKHPLSNEELIKQLQKKPQHREEEEEQQTTIFANYLAVRGLVSGIQSEAFLLLYLSEKNIIPQKTDEELSLLLLRYYKDDWFYLAEGATEWAIREIKESKWVFEEQKQRITRKTLEFTGQSMEEFKEEMRMLNEKHTTPELEEKMRVQDEREKRMEKIVGRTLNAYLEQLAKTT